MCHRCQRQKKKKNLRSTRDQDIKPKTYWIIESWDEGSLVGTQLKINGEKYSQCSLYGLETLVNESYYIYGIRRLFCVFSWRNTCWMSHNIENDVLRDCANGRCLGFRGLLYRQKLFSSLQIYDVIVQRQEKLSSLDKDKLSVAGERERSNHRHNNTLGMITCISVGFQ